MQTARSITVTAAAGLTVSLGLGVLTSCGTAAGQGDDDYTGPPVTGGTLRVAFDTDITCADGQQVGNNTALNVSRQPRTTGPRNGPAVRRRQRHCSCFTCTPSDWKCWVKQ
jgi:hypothetical protein